MNEDLPVWWWWWALNKFLQEKCLQQCLTHSRAADTQQGCRTFDCHGWRHHAKGFYSGNMGFVNKPTWKTWTWCICLLNDPSIICILFILVKLQFVVLWPEYVKSRELVADNKIQKYCSRISLLRSGAGKINKTLLGTCITEPGFHNSHIHVYTLRLLVQN